MIVPPYWPTTTLPRAARVSYLSPARRRVAVAGLTLVLNWYLVHQCYTSVSEGLVPRRLVDPAARATFDRLWLRFSHVLGKYLRLATLDGRVGF